MAGLLVASWLTPTVRSPRKLLFPYVISILLQLGFIGYLLSFVIYQQPLSNLCTTPAMLQFCAVYVFGVGTDADVATASVQAVLSAANAVARG